MNAAITIKFLAKLESDDGIKELTEQVLVTEKYNLGRLTEWKGSAG